MKDGGYLISCLFFLAAMAGNYMVFRKMGRQGWEGLIPIYNSFILFRELYGNGWKMLLCLVPIYGIYVAIKFYIDLAKAFEKPNIYALGLILMSPIFICLLGFDDSKFVGKTVSTTQG